MPTIDIVREVEVNASKLRLRQLGGIFDCPLEEKQRRHWRFNAPFEERPWNIGLIVGPSGAGKSTILRQLDVKLPVLEWDGRAAVIEQFPAGMSIEDVASVCAAVGFNTIPAWVRPYHVLSNGEQFRVTLARLLAEQQDNEVLGIDEFTSVVDRQVAQIASFACAKYVRRTNRRLIVSSCHEDIIEWLQPDWIIQPATESFEWRSLRRRPELKITIAPIHYSAWEIFAPHHYLTGKIHVGSRCWGLWLDGKLVSFTSFLRRPVPTARESRHILAGHRTVTLPDYQGLGLAHVLTEYCASIYKALGQTVRRYTAHPIFLRQIAKRPVWKCVRAPGHFQKKCEKNVGRPVAVFDYVGPPADIEEARRMMQFWTK